MLPDLLEAVEFPVYGRVEEDPRYFWQLVWKASPSLGEEGSPSLSELGEGGSPLLLDECGRCGPASSQRPMEGGFPLALGAGAEHGARRC